MPHGITPANIPMFGILATLRDLSPFLATFYCVIVMCQQYWSL